jgi:transposase-like protein
MELCKHCGSKNLRRNDFNKGKQRYFCKDCGKNQVASVKNAALTMYTEGCGFRSIARMLRRIFPIEINYQLVIYWIKKFGMAVEKKAEALSNSKAIPILELDESYTYIQKKQIKSEFGLLSTEIGCVLLRLK